MKTLPNSSKLSNSMPEMIGSLKSSWNSLKTNQDDESSRTHILGVFIQISGADRININENICELTPETHKALSSPTYTGKTKKNENDILIMNNIIRDLRYTGRGDRDSKRKTFFTKKLPKLADEIQKKHSMKIMTTLMIYKQEE